MRPVKSAAIAMVWCDLLDVPVADATKGHMSWHCCSSNLTCDKPLQQEGCQWDKKDQTEQEQSLWITLPSQELTHPRDPQMPSPSVFVGRIQVARFTLGGVWARRTTLGVQHKSMPFGSTSAVYGWHRTGCLPRDILVCIFLAPCCRYVDDFFGVDPAGCGYTRFLPSQICSLRG